MAITGGLVPCIAVPLRRLLATLLSIGVAFCGALLGQAPASCIIRPPLLRVIARPRLVAVAAVCAQGLIVLPAARV